MPKIVQFWFFCHVSAPSPLQSSVQYLHVIFMWVSSLNVPPRTPADPRQTILLTHSVPKVTIFKALGIVREEKHDSLGLWTWSLGCNLQSWSLPLSLTKRHVLLNILYMGELSSLWKLCKDWNNKTNTVSSVHVEELKLETTFSISCFDQHFSAFNTEKCWI